MKKETGESVMQWHEGKKWEGKQTTKAAEKTFLATLSAQYVFLSIVTENVD